MKKSRFTEGQIVGIFGRRIATHYEDGWHEGKDSALV